MTDDVRRGLKCTKCTGKERRGSGLKMTLKLLQRNKQQHLGSLRSFKQTDRNGQHTAEQIDWVLNLWLHFKN